MTTTSDSDRRLPPATDKTKNAIAFLAEVEKGQVSTQRVQSSESRLTQSGRWWSARTPSGCLGSLLGLALLVLIVVVVVAYALDWPPLAQINAYSPSTLQQPADLTRSPGLPEPAFVVLGEYNDEIYTFNRGVKRVYAYSGQTHKERQICSLAEFEAFWWHSSGKVLVLSRAYNPLGSLYLLDLASSSPKPSLITDRESDPRFPRSLSLEASLPLAWAKAGDKIAFVARDAQNNAESLFIFEIANTQLIYTPARNLGRISSLVWVEGDKKIALVAISDGQENRYLVEQSGGGFTAWTIQD